MEQKIIELETKFSYQEDLLQELNQQLIRQQKLLDAVLREVERLKQQLADVYASNDSHGSHVREDDKPPHY